MEKMRVGHFVRNLKNMIRQEGSLAFFLGAGCSISSGIPGAGSLVESWLPRLHEITTGGSESFDSWVSEELPNYNKANKAASYATVMKRLFPQAPQRQREIERIVLGRDPAFAYAVFAKLITDSTVGPRCNLVLTTKFDDMVADALYLYTQQKPLVIVHQSLAGFAETGLTRPLVMKLHGDALLEPKNTDEETATFPPEIVEALTEQLRKRGLIFIGYGGNDHSLVSFLRGLPDDALSWGVYWISSQIPDNDFGEWIESHPNAVWVDHSRFEELMLLVREEFELSHPDGGRFEMLLQTYRDNFAELDAEINAKPEDDTKSALETAASRATEQFGDWWAVELAARKLKKSDPEKADSVYRDGIEVFPRSAPLLGNYAEFMDTIRKDMDRAEELYLRAIDADPNNAINLGNYARFQQAIRKDKYRAKELFQRAIEAGPKNAINLGNYALFLQDIREEMDRAEELYRRAIEADPNNAASLGNYAVFMQKIRGNIDRAEELYRRALEAEPNNAYPLGNYGGLLLAKGATEKGLEYVQRALEMADPEGDRGLLLECQYYMYANGPAEGRDDSLRALAQLLKDGVRSPTWSFSANIDRAKEDDHPSIPFLEAMATVIADDVEIATLQEFDELKNL